MAGFENLQRELVHHSYQTQLDATELTRMLATGDYQPDTDVADLRETAAAFQRRHEAAEAVLAQLEHLAATALAGFVQGLAVHPNAAVREIAHAYTQDGTLEY